MPFHFNMLLAQAGIDPADVRLLRHQPMVAKRSLIDIWRGDRTLFEAYQSTQLASRRAQFSRPWWATFIGTWDGRTMFCGLYAAGTPIAVDADHRAPIGGAIDPAGTIDHYPLTPSPLLADYEGRLFIDWGGGSSGKRAWVQRADHQDKPVSELHLDALEQPFPGLMQLSSPLSALDAVPPNWVVPLEAAKGVYLLTCPRDGSLYVGSATGDSGFWGRWAEYRANGHGGNVAMRARDPSDYLVSILEVAGSTDTADDILAAEASWKRKLLAREHGLSRN